MLCTEVGERGAASQGLYRIPQKFWFLASHGSSIKHSSPPWAQCSWTKWNVPETSDWSHSCLIFMDICSVGRLMPLTQSIIQGVCSSYYSQHHILAPNSPIPKSGLHLKHIPLIGTAIHREQCARTFWNGSSGSKEWHAFPIFLRELHQEKNLWSPNIW